MSESLRMLNLFCESGKCIDRFWRHVDKSGECWVWTASLGTDGYGQFKFRKSILKAHRLAYRVEVGPVPAGLCVCHHCDNRKCVRPSHLFIGTRQDNLADMRAKGRQARGADKPWVIRGEKHYRFRLTPELVKTIKERIRDGNVSHRVLAKELGMSKGSIHRAIKKYAHV